MYIVVVEYACILIKELNNLEPISSYAFVSSSKHDDIKLFLSIVLEEHLLILNSLYSRRNDLQEIDAY